MVKGMNWTGGSYHNTESERDASGYPPRPWWS